MGQWRLQMITVPGAGLYMTISKVQITIAIPFVICFIGLSKDARGFDIFGSGEKH